MPTGLVSRGLSKVRAMVSGATAKKTEPSEQTLERIRQQLRECAEGRGGEVSTRQRAARLAETYLRLDDAGRHAFLRIIALEFGPDPKRVAKAHEAYQDAVGGERQWDAEAQLRAAMRSSRIRILTQFNAIPQGVKFLVDLRTDLLRFLTSDKELKPLDRELEARLSAWFDVGFLELQRITWHSPAALLEKLVEYEAVHEIRSWTDLKNRLDSDRRCYAFFHPRMPLEPLIFVEVALVEELADNVQKLLDEHAPVLDSAHARTAIFYSISSTQDGLRGVSFGNFLLKRVVEDLRRDFPRLDTFATLSPIPGLARWARRHPAEIAAAFTATDWKRLAAAGVADAESPRLRAFLDSQPGWQDDPALARALRDPLLRLAARYLLEARRDGRAADPVARFHLGNGARVERLNWMADISHKGLEQSWGMMVNYLYDPDRIETNLEAFACDGKVDAASAVRRQARR
ncbi:Malonyl-CoA decarboxylase [Pseudothauera nasutitermitis]|uniref:Malonyl-CoA decarboxylase n=1 Tax=Pseudothauera nasutitermitis TaxID=2565930 RepID=A0A4V3WBF5_9RHOO|nr:malonyl-CoA decarboxylase [Pseudothauera nasutitermitis]THF63009.1 Malonyl-CoA decarboxylase [Pseudothauera nasutitermitis]